MCKVKKTYVNLSSNNLETVEEECFHEGFKRLYEYFKLTNIFMTSQEQQIKDIT
jgi:hypothetical protein